MRVLKFLTCSLALLVWAVIGLLFWLALITRSVAAFSGMAIYAAVTGADVSRYSRHLENIAAFYPEGFTRIVKAVYRPEEADPEVFAFDAKTLARFAFELVWTIVFWTTLLYFPIQAWIRHSNAQFEKMLSSYSQREVPDSVKFEVVGDRTPVASVSEHVMRFDLIECMGQAVNVTCLFVVTTSRDIFLAVRADGRTVAFDNFGEEHFATRVSVRGNEGELIQRLLITNTPIPLRVEFADVASEVSQIQLLSLHVEHDRRDRFLTFREIPIMWR